MRIALVEERLVDPFRDAGARAIIDLQDSLTRLGHKSKIFYQGKHLRKQIHRYRASAILVSRPFVMAGCNDFKQLFRVPIIFWAQDFHSRRQSLGEKLGGASAHSSFLTSLVEKSALIAADVSVFPTFEEAEAVSKRFSLANTTSHPYFSFTDGEHPKLLERKRDIVFIGSSDHMPNREGLTWFLNSCWPSLHCKFSETRVWVIGNWDNSKLPQGKHLAVEFTGQIPEDQVNSIMKSSLIGISPLRFGAGIKRKTLQYLHSGLITVATDFGLEGLPNELDNKSWYRANGEEEFSKTLATILERPNTVGRISQAGREYVLKDFSEDKFDRRLTEILCQAGL